ncbi:uncharacterized protein LOC105217262 isoform X2 [Zeugodacus cucurbitae]|uniref:uncharacterized protein LOC105217262 isoform X2 n=1 Tax=Zeugodacus cucurbitae TaxID=28588 RepID=UPI0023D94A74|nr:uncharacterized protein LOC105217262 isoform X2 [Zeugodacus cucurbitae]
MSHIQSVKRVTHLQLFFLCSLLFCWIQNVNGIYEARRYSDRSRISCENPGTLPNGFSAPRRRNTMLTHHCNFGFKIFGDRRTNCNRGKWIGNRPICATNTCSFPAKNPENGRIQYVDQYHVGVYCSEGYELAGNRFAYCNGTDWDRPLGFCRLRPDKVRHECDFESDDICGWVTDIADGFGWKRTMATNVFTSFHTGPRHDHTTMRASGGHYMLMESFGLTSTPAALTSPIYERAISLKTACCFQFHYFMYGAGVGNLRVYVKPFTKMLSDVIDDQENFLKFKKSGNQNNNWNEAHFSIDEMEEDFQIVFVADGAKSHLSDIAIDDVKIMFGTECKSLDNHDDEADDSAEYEPTTTEQSLYDTLSCVSRCGEEANIGIMRNSTHLIGLCSCHDSCIVDDNCCPDYTKVCLDAPESTTVIPDIVTTTIRRDTKSTSTTSKEIIIKPPTTTTTTTKKATTTSTSTTTIRSTPITSTSKPTTTSTTTSTTTTTAKPKVSSTILTTPSTTKTTTTTTTTTIRTIPTTITTSTKSSTATTKIIPPTQTYTVHHTQPILNVTTAATIERKTTADVITNLPTNGTDTQSFVEIGGKYYLINTAVK